MDDTSSLLAQPKLAMGSDALTKQLLSDIKLTGFEDHDARSLLQAEHLLHKTKLISLRPLLPLLLTIKGIPYTLENHFPFEPFFKTHMPRKTVLISGRQVSKSTSQAAKAIVQSACIPWFSTLCITPQFEMIRRFSQNYVRPFIENSPVKHLFVGSSTVNSVLQRTFVNQAQMLFSFAFLSVDRVRGISADHMLIDESFCGITTYVKLIRKADAKMFNFSKENTQAATKAKCVRLMDVEPGDFVESFDGYGKKIFKRVVNSSYHGYRRCYRITTRSGYFIDATSESCLATPSGWIRVSQIIETARSATEVAESKSTQQATAHPFTNVADSRDDAGRRAYYQDRTIKNHTLSATVRVPLDEVHKLIRIRSWKSAAIEEEQIRLQVGGFLDCHYAGIKILSDPDVSGWKEAGDKRVAGPYRSDDAYPGDARMADRRRRISLGTGTLADTGNLYNGFYQNRKPTVCEMADEARLLSSNSSELFQSQQTTLENSLQYRRSDQGDAGCITVDAAVNAVQAEREPARQNQMSLLRRGDAAAETTATIGSTAVSLLRKESVHSGSLVLPREEILQQTRRCEAKIQTSQNTPFEKSTGNAKTKTATENLGSTQQRQNQNAQTKIQSQATIPGFLNGDDVISVEEIGLRHVYDIEVEGTHTFVANGLGSQNCQDIDKDFIPIIRETMSGSRFGGLESFSGTPKSLENTIEGLWTDSSQAEWVTRCDACGFYNIPHKDHHLNAMIGPYHDHISEQCPGVICAKCQRPINPRFGRWVHAHPERRITFAGYHVPQIIMPMHYSDPEKWSSLLAKREGRGNTPINVFYNEVCGISYDTGSRLVTKTELERAARLPWPRTIDEAVKHIGEYQYRVLAADWGGGGEDEVSFTVMAVLGMLPNGEIHVIWGHRSLTPHDHVREARLCLSAMQKFECQAFAHDYTGAGGLRETFMNQAGVPHERIIPVSYIRAAMSSRIMVMKPATKLNPRSYYQVDKTRSLLLTCNQIKNGGLKFFKWDYEDGENPGLIYDFLGLVDEKADSRIGKDVYTITRDPNMRDDFAQAVNIGCCTLWHMSDRWPDIASVAAMRVQDDFYSKIEPAAFTIESE